MARTIVKLMGAKFDIKMIAPHFKSFLSDKTSTEPK